MPLEVSLSLRQRGSDVSLTSWRSNGNITSNPSVLQSNTQYDCYVTLTSTDGDQDLSKQGIDYLIDVAFPRGDSVTKTCLTTNRKAIEDASSYSAVFDLQKSNDVRVFKVNQSGVCVAPLSINLHAAPWNVDGVLNPAVVPVYVNISAAATGVSYATVEEFWVVPPSVSLVKQLGKRDYALMVGRQLPLSMANVLYDAAGVRHPSE